MNKPFRLFFLLLISATLSLANASAFATTDFAMLPALSFKKPTHNVLLDIVRIDSRLVAVGEQGIIIFSDDEGQSWQQAKVPVSVTITAVYFTAPAHGWAVGHQGIILGSVDGGKSWQQQYSGYTAYQQALEMIARKIGRIEQQLNSNDPEIDKEALQLRLEELQFSKEDYQKTLQDGPSQPLLDIWFRDNQNGIAVGAYGLLIMTNDGGKHWQLHEQYLSNIDKFHFYSIAQSSNGDLFLAGESGTLWHSDNQGQSWQTLTAPYEGSLFGLISAKDGSLLTFGLRSNLFRTEDGGAHWQRITTDSDASLLGGTISDHGNIVLVGTSGTVLSSQDHGKSFQVNGLPDRSTLSSVIVLAENKLLLVGANGLEHLEINIE